GSRSKCRASRPTSPATTRPLAPSRSGSDASLGAPRGPRAIRPGGRCRPPYTGSLPGPHRSVVPLGQPIAPGDRDPKETTMKARTLILVFAALAAIAASAALAAGAGATTPRGVTVRMDGVLDPATLTVTGTWTATGAVSDSGTYHEDVVLDGHSIHLT